MNRTNITRTMGKARKPKIVAKIRESRKWRNLEMRVAKVKGIMTIKRKVNSTMTKMESSNGMLRVVVKKKMLKMEKQMTRMMKTAISMILNSLIRMTMTMILVFGAKKNLKLINRLKL
jgi:hypothetical protein